MALPTILSSAYSNMVDIVSTLNLDKPSGVQNGDLLVLFAMSSNDGTANWNTVSGWTRIIHEGNGTCDNDLAVYWKIAAGGEADPQPVTRGSSMRCHGWYLRIGPVHTTPINQVGSVTIGQSGDVDATEVTTDLDDCLAFSIFGFDGSDSTWTITGTGWSEIDDQQSNTGTTGISSAFATKNMASSGATVDCNGDLSKVDGVLGIQFAICGSQEAPEDFYSGKGIGRGIGRGIIR